MIVNSIKNGKEEKRDVLFDIKRISLDGLAVWAVVVDEHELCVLITNQTKNKMNDYDFGKMVINQYGCRWNIEEVFRFQKQVLNIENMRVRSMKALRNLSIIILFPVSLLFDSLSLSIQGLRQ